VTTYKRRGHWRRSPNGGSHWVSTHYVSRSSSDSLLPDTWSYGRSWTPYVPVPQPSPRRFSERWARPNARCPVCGQLVYFYSNEHGSRVYFDEMGPPWPKHPCTMRSSSEINWPVNQPQEVNRPTAPPPYSFADGRRAVSRARIEPTWRAPDGSPYERFVAEPWLVLNWWTGGGRTLMRLHRLYHWEPPAIWQADQFVRVNPGDIVFIKNGEMSFFHLASCEVAQVRVTYIGSLPKKPLLERIIARFKGEPPI